jgi:hypothetical protein
MAGRGKPRPYNTILVVGMGRAVTSVLKVF